MRIVQSCFRFAAPGGAEDHVLQISREMVRRGHDVTVHASDIHTETPWKRGDRPPKEVLEGIRVVRHAAFIRPLAARWSTLVIPDMVSGLLDEDCDLYHAHSHRYFQLEAASAASRVRGKPLVITPHYHPAEGKETLRTRALLRLYDLYSAGSIYSTAERVLTMTDLEKAHISSFAPPGKCTTVGAGIDPSEWERLPGPSPFRDACGVSGPFILYAGRLATNKGLEFLFGALPAVFRKFEGGLVVVGKDWGMKERLEGLARKGGFSDRVRFVDFFTDRELYKSALCACELLVLPSEWEAFGLVLLEAAMCQKPVVATRVGGVPEVVLPGKTGLLVDHDDAEGLSSALLGLLGDPALRARMGEAGRQNALERHTWPKVTDRIMKVYEEVLS